MKKLLITICVVMFLTSCVSDVKNLETNSKRIDFLMCKAKVKQGLVLFQKNIFSLKKINNKQNFIDKDTFKRKKIKIPRVSKWNYQYRYDFPKHIGFKNAWFRHSFKENHFLYLRQGSIRNGRKKGKWITEQWITRYSAKIVVEEYFKDGLRDSIYRCYNRKGAIIYSTTFSKGTGLWKVFHENDSLYFKMYTNNGYFTDTLKINDYNGKVIGKRLYLKDSLIYKEGLSGYPDTILKPFHNSLIPQFQSTLSSGHKDGLRICKRRRSPNKFRHKK